MVRETMAVFGGTFDPIHYGHCRSAVHLLDKHHFSQLRVIPCGTPAHRNAPQASATDRLVMCQLALGKISEKILIDDFEIQQMPEPSYMVNTLSYLKREHPNHNICLILGEDAFHGLCSWYEWKQLASLTNILVIPRPLSSQKESVLRQETVFKRIMEPHILHDVESGCIFYDNIAPLPVSSSHIREQLRKGENPQFLLPDSILSYIKDHQLYMGDDITHE